MTPMEGIVIFIKPVIDLVVLRRDFPREYWFKVRHNFYCYAQLMGSPIKPIKYKKKFLHAITTKISVEGRKVTMVLQKNPKTAFIQYTFNGSINIEKLSSMTEALDALSLAKTMKHGRVARIEFAQDVIGREALDFIFHAKGARSSKRCQKGNGVTYYLGSKDSHKQFCIYDKSQEILAKGGTPMFSKLLRIELRVLKSELHLRDLLVWCLESDPFNNLLAIRTPAAHRAGNGNPEWMSFVDNCVMSGGPQALKYFPQQKKTYLKKMAGLTVASLKLSMARFQESCDRLLLPIGGFQSLHGEVPC
jgi:hypothetical protein